VPERDETTAILLDECIQALMDGEDWREVMLAHEDEMAPLVAVGHWLLELARNVPPATTEGRTRIWRRISDSIDVGRLAALVLPAVGSNPEYGPGVPAHR
jgi:hypothetical protein